MRTIYISNCTEYEAGWGQRPDGFILAVDRDLMVEYIKTKGNSGSPSYYWRYEEIKEVHCSTKTYDKVVKKLTEDNVAHFTNSAKIKLKLFKRIN